MGEGEKEGMVVWGGEDDGMVNEERRGGEWNGECAGEEGWDGENGGGRRTGW